MLIILSFIFLLIGGLFLFRWIYRLILRSQHAIPPSGIDLMETVEIGGIRQVLYVRGQDRKNPVILYLHGGPASTEMQLLHGFQYDWEPTYTVVHWDQRQAGKTWLSNDPDRVGNVTFDRLLNDAWEVTQYILNKFHKDTLILMGHSWGTILGSALVQAHPQAFAAYIGVGQITHWRENERIGYHLVLEKARQSGNAKDCTKLEALGAYLSDPYDASVFSRFRTVRGFQGKYKVGAGVDIRLILLALSSPYYRIRDVMVMFGKVWNYQDELFRYLFTEYDAARFGTTYTVPVFYVMGERDYVASRELAGTFLENIQAPHRQLFLVPGAGHMTMTDQPKAFTRILLTEITPRIFNQNI